MYSRQRAELAMSPCRDRSIQSRHGPSGHPRDIPEIGKTPSLRSRKPPSSSTNSSHRFHAHRTTCHVASTRSRSKALHGLAEGDAKTVRTSSGERWPLPHIRTGDSMPEPTIPPATGGDNVNVRFVRAPRAISFLPCVAGKTMHPRVAKNGFRARLCPSGTTS